MSNTQRAFTQNHSGQPAETRCAAEWQANAALHAEFSDVEAYVAFTKAAEAGLVRGVLPRAAPAGASTTPPLEARCKAEWRTNAALRTEFCDVEAYIAFTKATDAGLAKVLGTRTRRQE